MARKRSIPTDLFASPDFFELSSNTVRLILIGVILDADDEGRGCAHSQLLARKLDQQAEDITQALVELVARGILQCFEVAGRSYYWLCHWNKYQILSKPTPSNYPAPPKQKSNGIRDLIELEDAQSASENTVCEGEREALVSMTAVTVAPALSSGDDDTRIVCATEKKQLLSTTQVASVLHLLESQELHEVVQEFMGMPTLSVIGEAIEARAWIDDERRNNYQQHMTPAFFRRWLRRTRRVIEQSSKVGKQQIDQMFSPFSIGTTESIRHETCASDRSPRGERQRLSSLMHLADLDQQTKGAFC